MAAMKIGIDDFGVGETCNAHVPHRVAGLVRR
jgi:hypothetical protein